MFDVTFQPYIPTRYELATIDDGTTIVIKIPTTLWECTLLLFTKKEFVTELQKRLRIPAFIPPGHLPWGFGPVFAFDETNRDTSWTVLLCELPQLSRQDTTPEESDMFWHRAFGLSASMSWLFDLIRYAAKESKHTARSRQLLEVAIGLGYDDGRHRCSISAGLCTPVCQWIESQVKHLGNQYNNHYEMTTAMTNAYKRLYGVEEIDIYHRYDLRAEIASPCRIHFNTPGDRAGLGSFTNCPKENGVDLYDHNIDTPMQQLVLLAGVATLYSILRKDGL